MSRAEESFALAWAQGVRAAQPEAAPAPPAKSTHPDAVRSHRHRETRPRTENVRRLPRHAIEEGRRLSPAQPGVDYHRPKTYSECVGGERPCPFVSCAHHLYLDVNPRNGSVKINFPDLEVWELAESCARDVGERGGASVDEVAAIFNVTRQRIQQLEVKGLAKLKRADRRLGGALAELAADEGLGRPVRRLPVLDEPEEDEEGETTDVVDEDLSASKEESADAAE